MPIISAPYIGGRMPSIEKYKPFTVTLNSFPKEVRQLENNWTRLSCRREKYIHKADQTDKQKRMLYTMAKIAFALAIISGIGAVYATTIYGASSLIVTSLKISGVIVAGSGIIVGSIGLYIRHIQKTVLNILNHSGEVKSKTMETFNPEVAQLIADIIINDLSTEELKQRAQRLNDSSQNAETSDHIIDQLKAYAEKGTLTTQDLVRYAQNQKAPAKEQSPIIRKEKAKTFLQQLIDLAEQKQSPEKIISYAQKMNPLVTTTFVNIVQAIRFLIKTCENESPLQESSYEGFLQDVQKQNNPILSNMIDKAQHNILEEDSKVIDIIRYLLPQKLINHAQAIQRIREYKNKLVIPNIKPIDFQKAKSIVALAPSNSIRSDDQILDTAESRGLIKQDGITREQASQLIQNHRNKQEFLIAARNSDNPQLQKLELHAQNSSMNIQQMLEYAEKNRPIPADLISFTSTSFLTSMIGIGYAQFLGLMLESSLKSNADNGKIPPFPSLKEPLRLAQLIDVPKGGAVVIFRNVPDWKALMQKGTSITNNSTEEVIPFIQNGRLHPKLRVVFPGEWLSSSSDEILQIQQALQFKALNPDQVFFSSEKLKKAPFFNSVLKEIIAYESNTLSEKLSKRLQDAMRKIHHIFDQFLPNDIDLHDLVIRQDSIDHPDRPPLKSRSLFYPDNFIGKPLSKENSQQKPQKPYLMTQPNEAVEVIPEASFMRENTQETQRESAGGLGKVEWDSGQLFAYTLENAMGVISYNMEGKRRNMRTIPLPKRLQAN